MTARWPALIRLFHAMTALVAIVIIPCAFVAEALTESQTDWAEWLIGLHMAGGLAIALMTLARLSARLVLKAPSDVPRPLALRLLVGAGTLAFYALLLLLPITGVLKLTLSGLDVAPFGLVVIPSGTEAPALARTLSTVHAFLGKALIVAALLHALAALTHQRLFGTQVLGRMGL